MSAPQISISAFCSNQLLEKRHNHVNRKGLQCKHSNNNLSITFDIVHWMFLNHDSIGRVRGEEAELMSPPFVLPAEALSPQATGNAPMMAPESAAADSLAADGLGDLFSPAIPVPGSEFLAGTGLETLEAPATDYSSYGGPLSSMRSICLAMPKKFVRIFGSIDLSKISADVHDCLSTSEVTPCCDLLTARGKLQPAPEPSTLP